MAKGVNKWIGIGNCCKDPETRYLASGGAVTNISVACNNSYKDKGTGKIVDTTEFVRVIFFNRLAEIAGEYLKKGSKVYIEGSLKTRKWQDQSGQDRYSTEIVASEMQMIDSKPSEAGHQSSGAAREHYAPQPEPTQGPVGGGWSDPQSTGAPEGMLSHPGNDPWDIPF